MNLPALHNRLLFTAAVAAALWDGPMAAADDTCRADGLVFVTVSGIIHGPRTEIRPIINPDGTPDYSIVETIDEYELTSPNWPCGPGPLRVRLRYGHVKTAGCADGVPATVSGIYQNARDGGRAHLEVMSPSDLKCSAEKR